MYEKVSPCHPDKIADRIAGALVSLAYKKENNPKIAVEVLLGHGACFLIIESSVEFTAEEMGQIVYRISGIKDLRFVQRKQDKHLAGNQEGKIRCGDNGIFRGMPVTVEQAVLTAIARELYDVAESDGKYIIDHEKGELIICQSNMTTECIGKHFLNAKINPLGDWTGGTDVDAGATNRKLGSDMGDAVTGGGLHGKDLSKADVSVNIYAHLKAQETGKPVEIFCAIGDEVVDGRPYEEIVEIAKNYIKEIGGFEKFAEWGLIR